MSLTRAGLAAIVHDRIQEIANTLGWSYTASEAILLEAGGKLLLEDGSVLLQELESQNEGDYTYAIDSALRDMELLDSDDAPDITEAEVEQYNTLVEVVERYMLQKAQRALALKVDLALGPRRQAFSQQAKAVGELSRAGGSRRVVAMRLRHERYDYPRTDDVETSEAVDEEWDI